MILPELRRTAQFSLSRFVDGDSRESTAVSALKNLGGAFAFFLRPHLQIIMLRMQICTTLCSDGHFATTFNLGMAVPLDGLLQPRIPNPQALSACVTSPLYWSGCRVDRGWRIQAPVSSCLLMLVMASHESVQLIFFQTLPYPVLLPVTLQQPKSHLPFSHSHSLECGLFSRFHSIICWTTKRLQLETQSIPKSLLPDSFAPQLSTMPTTTSPPVHDTSWQSCLPGAATATD